MIYSLRGTVGAMILFAGVGTWAVINRSVNYSAAKATVEVVDRTCDIIETSIDEDGEKSSDTYKDDCDSIDAWQTASAKRDKTIAGKAVVTVTYTAPQDGSSHETKLQYSARDKEFYDLNAGDEINILVSKSDPEKILKA